MNLAIALSVYNDFLDGGVRSADYIAEKYETSKRTAYRYVAALIAAGVPLSTKMGRNGGWQLDEKFTLPAACFTKEEFERLNFCLQSAVVSDDVTESVRKKLAGIGRGEKGVGLLSSDQLIVDDRVEEDVLQKLTVLRQALAQKRIVSMDYHSKEGASSRDVEPYCFVLREGEWYVYCYCRLRKDFRYFKLTRIVSLEMTDKRFAPRKYSVSGGSLEGSVLADKEKTEVILTVRPFALAKVEEWLGVSRVAKLGDEYVAKATCAYDDFLIDKILSFGSGVVVEKPDKLRRAVAEKCNEILSNYR